MMEKYTFKVRAIDNHSVITDITNSCGNCLTNEKRNKVYFYLSVDGYFSCDCLSDALRSHSLKYPSLNIMEKVNCLLDKYKVFLLDSEGDDNAIIYIKLHNSSTSISEFIEFLHAVISLLAKN